MSKITYEAIGIPRGGHSQINYCLWNKESSANPRAEEGEEKDGAGKYEILKLQYSQRIQVLRVRCYRSGVTYNSQTII